MRCRDIRRAALRSAADGKPRKALTKLSAEELRRRVKEACGRGAAKGDRKAARKAAKASHRAAQLGTPEARPAPAQAKSGAQKPMRSGRPSRRHPDSAAHFAARDAYQAEHGRGARQERAAERRAERVERTDEEQIQALDQRLGEGVGATAERIRLHQRIGEAA